MRERLAAGMSPRQVAEEMCDHCLAPDTGGCGKGCDNMSVSSGAGPRMRAFSAAQRFCRLRVVRQRWGSLKLWCRCALAPLAGLQDLRPC